MDKNRMIIVEGPQGTGKTTLTDYLRDNIPASNLYRLSGHKVKSIEGKEMSKIMYLDQLDYLEKLSKIPMDLIFDRTFFTEEVYARLGYKEYGFTDIFHELVNRLNSLNYEMYLVVLHLENTELFKQRLDRKSHHNYQSFSIQNSINQQNTYLQFVDELKNTNIHIIPLAMDDFDIAYKKVDDIFRINK